MFLRTRPEILKLVRGNGSEYLLNIALSRHVYQLIPRFAGADTVAEIQLNDFLGSADICGCVNLVSKYVVWVTPIHAAVATTGNARIRKRRLAVGAVCVVHDL